MADGNGKAAGAGITLVFATPEVANGTHPNNAMVAYDYGTFVLDFFSLLPGMPAGRIESRVVVSAERFALFLDLMNAKRAEYEARFGAIPRPPVVTSGAVVYEAPKLPD